ncbi:MAG: A/G-specific adenine glycosylase [Gammaproteobacteria bacterium]|nr:A/G-specific adenine glycosylase [Gammaproteobacteria bacterium]
MRFAERLLDWYTQHGRHDLPWQVRGTPYPVWISEIMLQQTQVSTVIPYFERFMKQFPDLLQLADAELDHVLHLWSGLGYYARARNLHKTATIITDQYKGDFPQDIDELIALPGIGRSTAGAILAQSLGQRHPILDGNVKRVLARYFCVKGWPGSRETEKELWRLSDNITPTDNSAEYTQAIMDLGATVCKRSKPDCQTCPVNKSCQALLTDEVSTYPHKKARKTLPIKSTSFLLLKNKKGEVFLTQRPPTGIWGGLWCLPEISQDSEPETVHNSLPAYTNTGNPTAVTRHTFSHYHLDFTVIPAVVKGEHANTVMEATPAVWYNPDKPSQLGLAAPIKKIIHSHEV